MQRNFFICTISQPPQFIPIYREGVGGSWSVPYLAGIVALTLQVNPNLSEKQISGLISETATTNSNGLKVINPEKAIEKASKMAQEQ